MTKEDYKRFKKLLNTYTWELNWLNRVSRPEWNKAKKDGSSSDLSEYSPTDLSGYEWCKVRKHLYKHQQQKFSKAEKELFDFVHEISK